MKIVRAFITVLSIAFSMARAADLDAPAVKPITIRSEIERGDDAVFNLDTMHVDLLSYLDAFSAVLNENKQSNKDTDGFILGANYCAWRDLEATLHLDGIGNLNSADAIQVSKDEDKLCFEAFRDAQKKLALTNQEVSDALGMKKEFFEREIAAWEKENPTPEQKQLAEKQAAEEASKQQAKKDADAKLQAAIAAAQARGAAFQHRLAAGQIFGKLKEPIDIPSAYGKITIPAGAPVTIVAIGETITIRQGASTLSIPKSAIDLPPPE